MKKNLLILTILFFHFTYGQIGLSSYPADIPMKDSLSIDIVDIQKTPFTFYFRLLLSGQIIDIFSQDNKKFYGEITNSVKEYKSIKINDEYRTKAVKIYKEKVEINTLASSLIAHQILNSGQASIPTDSLISSWTKWYFHCGNLNFEIKKDSSYVKQSFHCPWSQPDSVEFKEIILSNYNFILQNLNLDSVYQNFWSQLPKGKTYSRSGYKMTYIMTDEQVEVWNKGKSRRDYLKSLRDTIDNHIRNELQKQHISLKGIDCFEDYYLTFNEKGYLLKVKVANCHKPKIIDGLSWYLEDMREIRKCKKLIRKIFKEINLSSFNLRYKVYRKVSFGLGETIQLYDPNIY